MADFRKHAALGTVPYLIFAGVAFALAVGFHMTSPAPRLRLLLPATLREAGICLIIAFVGSLFPDTDIKSKSQKLVYRLLFILDIVLIIRMQYEWAAMLGWFAMFPLLGKHRGWTHSRLTMLLLPLPLLAYPMLQTHSAADLSGLPRYLAAVFGYATHLALDGQLLPSRQQRRS